MIYKLYHGEPGVFSSDRGRGQLGGATDVPSIRGVCLLVNLRYILGLIVEKEDSIF